MKAAVKTTAIKLPFSDFSQTKPSKTIKEIVATIEPDLLVIYGIGHEKKCSHYKHFVRLVEKIISADKSIIQCDFDEKKIQKTIDNFDAFVRKGNQESRSKVVEHSYRIKEALKKVLSNEVSLLGTKDGYLVQIVLDLLESFDRGFGDIPDFHKGKISLIEGYNNFAEQVGAVSFSSIDETALAKIGVPII